MMIELPSNTFISDGFLINYNYHQKSGTVKITLLLKEKPNEKQRKQLTMRNAQRFTLIAWETDKE